MDKAIKKIVLDLDGKEIELTPKQAQNLKNALDELFDKKIVKEVIHEYIPNPYPVVIREPSRPWSWEPHRLYGDTGCTSTDTVFTCETNTLKLTG